MPRMDKVKKNSHCLVDLAARKHFEQVVDLLDAGANANSHHKDGYSALMAASQNGSTEIVEELISRGADVNGSTDEGTTALMYAVMGGHRDIVQTLVESSAQVNDQMTSNAGSLAGFTSLMFSARNGLIDITKLLISAGAIVDRTDADGETALFKATVGGHREIVRYLLDHRADPNICNVSNETASDIAYALGQGDMVSLLQKARVKKPN